MPTIDIILVLAVVAAAMVLFATQKLRVDLVALCVLVSLLLLGLIDSEQALHGFANPATATVAAMFVLSAGLVRTGLVEWVGRRLDRVAGKTRSQLLLVLCITIAFLSAFIVNTATVAIFIPIAIALAHTRHISVSRVLIPLSFASQFGGVCTLIGTSTNILVNSIAVSNGLGAFGLFEFAPLGMVMTAIGIVYLLFVSGRLLPERKGEVQRTDKYRLADYLAELTVKEGSSLIGKRWRSEENRFAKSTNLIKLIRDDVPTWRASRTFISENDVLLVHGNADDLIKLKDEYNLATRADAAVGDKNLKSDEMSLIEALVPPRSRFAERSLRAADLPRRFGSVVLAVQRRARILRTRLEHIRLQPGDTLLLQSDKEGVERLMGSRDLIVTNEVTELQVRADRALVALGLLVLVVALAAFGIVPIVVAALLGAVGMVLGGCLTLEEAYQAIDWKVIFLLAGILPLGLALQQSGAAAWLAGFLLGPIVQLGPIAVLAGLYLITAALTETMSNNAAAVLLAPIAISLAAAMGVSPRPFLVAITFAASTSFATPIGYQTNTMIYVPGGYRFLDFTRVGVPLNLLFWIAAVLLIPLLWPF